MDSRLAESNFRTWTRWPVHGERLPSLRVTTRARVTAKPSREKGMNSIRLKVTIHLNRNHALSVRDLNALKPLVERGIAAFLPDSIAVDTIRVTKVKETRTREPEIVIDSALHTR
jgi:hypothetical protein